MRKLLAVVALAVAAGAAINTARAETTLRVANWLPQRHTIPATILEPWAKRVAAESGGRLRLEIMQAPLGKPPAQFDIARDGLADIAYGIHGYTPGRFTLTKAAELPFLSDSAEALSVAHWRVHDKLFRAADEHKGVVILALFAHAPGLVVNSKRPIRTVADFQGLKLRTSGGVINDIAEALGVVAIGAPAPKSYELMANGTIDGAFFPFEGVAGFKLGRIVKHATRVPGGLYNTSFFVVMNQDRWRSLSAGDRAALMRASGESLSRLAGRAYDAAENRALDETRKAGVAIIQAEPDFVADLRAKTAFTVTDWIAAARAKGVDGQAAVDMLRAEIAKAKP